MRFLQISPQPTRQLLPTKETTKLFQITVEFLSSGILGSQAMAIIKYLNKIRLHRRGDKNKEDNLEIQMDDMTIKFINKNNVRIPSVALSTVRCQSHSCMDFFVRAKYNSRRLPKRRVGANAPVNPTIADNRSAAVCCIVMGDEHVFSFLIDFALGNRQVGEISLMEFRSQTTDKQRRSKLFI